MYIDAFNNSGKIDLRLVESYRTVDDDGKQHIRRRIICSLGPLSRFNDGMIHYNRKTKQITSDEASKKIYDNIKSVFIDVM